VAVGLAQIQTGNKEARLQVVELPQLQEHRAPEQAVQVTEQAPDLVVLVQAVQDRVELA
jgi:hypothetical protein